MSKKHQELKARLTDAIVNLCRQEAFYFQELKIEGTVCLTSDGSSVLITQITEQIGEQFDGVDNSENLPVRSKDKDEDKNGEQKGDVIIGEQQKKDGDGVSITDSTDLPIERTDGKFKCPHCPKLYQFKHSLKDHLNVHTGKKPHVCKHCNYAFTHFASLCAHIKKRHYQHMPDGFECHICEEKFMNEQSLKQHFTWRHKGELPLQWALAADPDAVDDFEEDPDAAEEEETESKMGEGMEEAREQSIATEEGGLEKTPIKEEKEEMRIKTEKSQDEREVTGNSTPLTPETPQLPPGVTWNPALAAMQAATAMGMRFPGFMQSPFTAPGSVGAEVANHAGAIYALSQLSQATPSPGRPRQDFERSPSGKFLCPYCDKQYNFKHTLKDHVNKHLGKRPHVCKHCGDSFTHLASLCAHIKRRHNAEISSEYQCEICNEKFMNFQSLKQHYTWRHKDKKVPLKRTVPPPEAAAAVQPTRKSARLTTTPPTASQSVFPGSSFEDPDAQPMHNSQSSIEDNSLLLSTDGANESFESSTSSLLSQPHASVDGMAGNHDDAPSASIHEYFTDINVTTPQGLYKYKCKLCGNMFKIRNSLYEHLNSHLGRKPHVCSYCGDAFTHHSSLHNHVRNKHTSQSREEREAQFKHECVACHRKFRFKSELERHIRYNPDHAEGSGDTVESDKESTTERLGDSPPTEDGEEVGNSSQ